MTHPTDEERDPLADLINASALSPADQMRLLAGVDLIGRASARELQIRYDDQQYPIVWTAVALPKGTENYVVGAAFNPVSAVTNLCENLVDGGTCVHCQRPTVFFPEPDAKLPAMFLAAFCTYMWDPAATRYRRDCEEAPSGDR